MSEFEDAVLAELVRIRIAVEGSAVNKIQVSLDRLQRAVERGAAEGKRRTTLKHKALG